MISLQLPIKSEKVRQFPMRRILTLCSSTVQLVCSRTLFSYHEVHDSNRLVSHQSDRIHNLICPTILTQLRHILRLLCPAWSYTRLAADLN